MDEFESAVLILFTNDQRVPQDRKRQAHSYCESIKSSPTGWRLCWQRFLQCTSLEARFWSLQVVLDSLYPPEQDSDGDGPHSPSPGTGTPLPSSTGTAPLCRLSPEDRQSLRTDLIQYLTEGMGKRASVDPDPIKNKLALLYVLLVKIDYLDLWGSALTDLITIMGFSHAAVDMYLRILWTLDQEIAAEDIQKSEHDKRVCTAIKDTMRTRDMTQLTESWYLILTSSHLRFGDEGHNRLLRDCLLVVSRYSLWIDYGLVANVKFVECVFELVQSTATCEAALACITAIIYKRMDSSQKICYLKNINIVNLFLTGITQFLTSSNSSVNESSQAQIGCPSSPLLVKPHNDSKRDQLREKWGETLNVLGTKLIECVERLRGEVLERKEKGDLSSEASPPPHTPGVLRVFNLMEKRELAQNAWEMTWSCLQPTAMLLASPSAACGAVVEPFLSLFYLKLKNFSSLEAPDAPPVWTSGPMEVALLYTRSFTMRVMPILLCKIQYPPHFTLAECFAAGEQDEADEEEEILMVIDARQRLSKLFKRIALCDEIAVERFLLDLTTTLASQPHDTLVSEWPQVEAALYLFYTAGEQQKDLASRLRETTHPTTQSLQLILSSPSILRHPHPVIRCLIFSIANRYTPFFQHTAPHHVPTLLDLLLGPAGVRSGEVKVVSQAASTMLRFIKTTLSLCLPYTLHLFESSREVISIGFFPSTPTARGDSYSNIVRPPPSSITFEDQLRLLESLGSLLGSNAASESATGTPPRSPSGREQKSGKGTGTPQQNPPQSQANTGTSTSPTGLTRIARGELIHSLLAPLAKAVSVGVDVIKSDPVGYGDWFARLIMGVVSVSKGFPPHTMWGSLFTDAYASVRCVQILPMQPKLRNAVLLFSRRLVALTDTESLPHIAQVIPALYAAPPQTATPTELGDLCSFIVHLITSTASTTPLSILKAPAVHHGSTEQATLFEVAFKRHYTYRASLGEFTTNTHHSQEVKRERVEAEAHLIDLLQAVAAVAPSLIFRMLMGPTSESPSSQPTSLTVFHHLSQLSTATPLPSDPPGPPLAHTLIECVTCAPHSRTLGLNAVKLWHSLATAAMNFDGSCPGTQDLGVDGSQVMKIILEGLPVQSVVERIIASSVVTLSAGDPLDLRVLNEVASLFRLLCGGVTSRCVSSYPDAVAHYKQIVSNALVGEGGEGSRQDVATLVEMFGVAGQAPQQSNEAFRRFVVSVQQQKGQKMIGKTMRSEVLG
eukprot:GHVN01051297.1.p1 GENE.GHVN01051297.1~~GHVN01051297.1.p1  ORF type:complete len:1237 (+),score=285.00 GHVN01051297.1:110-3820(+)